MQCGRYLDNLVGPYPEAKTIFEERSAMRHVNDISCPILLLQGIIINALLICTECYRDAKCY
jgi:dipeptidyl aminopeptidase/acylaminoacyl peptidase